VKTFLIKEHGDVLDQGAHGADRVDYSDYAAAVGLALRAERGFLLCGSRVNRIPGIRAGLCHVPIRRIKVSSTTT
jgi:ribose 5-phosphate isomerase RpiB